MQESAITLEDAVMKGIENFDASRSYVGSDRLSERGKKSLRSHVTSEVQRGISRHLQALTEEIVPEGDKNELEMAYNVVVAFLLRYCSGNGTELAESDLAKARDFVLDIEREYSDEHDAEVLSLKATHYHEHDSKPDPTGDLTARTENEGASSGDRQRASETSG